MRTDRGPDELRRVTIQRGYTEMTPGSVLIAMGHTRVLCTVSFDFDVPPWMRSKGEGWVTAEYAMLPAPAVNGSRAVRSAGGGSKRFNGSSAARCALPSIWRRCPM